MSSISRWRSGLMDASRTGWGIGQPPCWRSPCSAAAVRRSMEARPPACAHYLNPRRPPVRAGSFSDPALPSVESRTNGKLRATSEALRAATIGSQAAMSNGPASLIKLRSRNTPAYLR